MSFRLCVVVLGVLVALVLAVDGGAPLPARPPLGSGGFIVNESSTSSSSSNVSGSGIPKSPAAAKPSKPSFVSVGIRSGCARERAATAATLRNKGVAGASAASRLRGGSTWIPHPPVKFSRADLEHSQAKTISSADPVSLHRPTESSSCNSKGGGGGGNGDPNHNAAEFAVSKQRVVEEEEESADPLAFEDEEEEGVGGAIGGGGGGGRVGTPSIPRALKKFAWVP